MMNEDNGTMGLAPLIDANGAAAFLGVTTARLYGACREGLIPHIRIGRSVRFSRPDLMDWVANGGSTYAGGWRRETEA